MFFLLPSIINSIVNFSSLVRIKGRPAHVILQKLNRAQWVTRHFLHESPYCSFYSFSCQPFIPLICSLNISVKSLFKGGWCVLNQTIVLISPALNCSWTTNHTSFTSPWQLLGFSTFLTPFHSCSFIVFLLSSFFFLTIFMISVKMLLSVISLSLRRH